MKSHNTICFPSKHRRTSRLMQIVWRSLFDNVDIFLEFGFLQAFDSFTMSIIGTAIAFALLDGLNRDDSKAKRLSFFFFFLQHLPLLAAKQLDPKHHKQPNLAVLRKKIFLITFVCLVVLNFHLHENNLFFY